VITFTIYSYWHH